MKFDRGFIKWQPFNAVVPSKYVIDSLEREKIVQKPVLSTEQIDNLNELIIEAYYGQYIVKIEFYEENKITSLEGVIKKIDSVKNIIELDNHKIIAFKQVLNVIIN